MDKLQEMAAEMSAESPAEVLEKITTPAPVETPVAEGAVAEKPVDTTPVPVINPPADEAPKLSEEQQAYLDSLEKPIENGKEKNQEVQAEDKTQERVLAEYDDDFIKDYRDIKKKGGDVKKWMKDIASDVKELSPSQVMEKYLQIEYRGELSEQEVKDSIEETFGDSSTLTALEKKQKLINMRDKVAAHQSEQAKKYISSLPDNSVNIEQEKTRYDGVIKKAQSDLGTIKEQMVGKSILGMPVDEEKWNKIDAHIQKEATFNELFPVFDDNGRITGYETDKAVEFAAYKLFKNEIAKANIALGEIKGYNRLYEQRKRPSQENTQTGVPVNEQDLDDAMKNINFRNK